MAFLKPEDSQEESSDPLRPKHYGELDPYTYALENELGVLEFSIVKYITRWKKKDGLKDLYKAAHTLQRLIDEVDLPKV